MRLLGKRNKLIIVGTLIVAGVLVGGYFLYIGLQNKQDSLRLSITELEPLSEFARVRRVSSVYEDGVYSEQYRIDARLNGVVDDGDVWTLFLSDFDTENSPVEAELQLTKALGLEEYNLLEYVTEGSSIPISLQCNFINTGDVELTFPEYIDLLVTGTEFEVNGELDYWSVILGGEAMSPNPFTTDGVRTIGDSILSWVESVQSDAPLPGGTKYVVETGEVIQEGSSPRTSLFVLWGLADYYPLATAEKQEEILSFLEKEIATFTGYSMQSNDWSCNLLREAADNLSGCTDERCMSIQTDFKRLCEEDYSLGGVESPAEEYSTLEAVLEQRGADTTGVEYANSWGVLIPEATVVSNLVAKDDWLGTKENLDKAKSHYKKATRIYSKQEGSVYANGLCTLGIAALDLFSVTNDVQYKNDAGAIVENVDFEEECLTDRLNRFSCHSSVINESRCAMFLVRYSREFGGANELAVAKKLTKDVVSRNFDYSSYPGYASGIGAFYNRGVNSDSYEEQEYGVYEYDVRLNGQMLNLIHKFIE